MIDFADSINLFLVYLPDTMIRDALIVAISPRGVVYVVIKFGLSLTNRFKILTGLIILCVEFVIFFSNHVILTFINISRPLKLFIKKYLYIHRIIIKVNKNNIILITLCYTKKIPLLIYQKLQKKRQSKIK